jgi:hypothetical protein
MILSTMSRPKSRARIATSNTIDNVKANIQDRDYSL